ncbi:amidase [Flavisolibacter sp. BT320]|nr:amidase [Flavisolibacter longurius]
MRKLFTAFALSLSFFSFSQTHQDSIRFLQQVATLYDLDFTEAEIDSLQGNIINARSIYVQLHKELPKNDLAFPFAFNPAPYGTKVPVKQQKIAWDLPANVTLPKDRNELAFYTVAQLASLIKNKKITSVELTRFFLDRLKKWSDTLECVVTLTEERAMEEARAADAELKKGLYRGPLHGIPYGLKDLFAVKGYKTTWGAMPYKDQELDVNAYVYTKLKAAGAVLCAKLTLGALAMGERWYGGFTRSPWNLQQGSSGSSAGSGSAVAAGLLPFAIGTETLGSIVSPSTRNGVTGLRPTFGTISRSGAMVLCWSLDKAGPMSRSAEDNAIIYYYLKGTDEKDPGSVDHAFNYNAKRDIKKLRIAYAENYFSRLPKDAQEWSVIDAFKKMGAQVKAVNFPDSAVYPANYISTILGAEAAAAFDELTRSGRDSLLVRQDRFAWPTTFRAGRYIPAVEYINANRYRSRLSEQVQAFMKDYDVVIAPSFAGRQLAITNLTGNPVVCLPMGFNQRGLPQSITFIGNLYDEASVLEAAKAYQAVTDHDNKHPEKFKN